MISHKSRTAVVVRCGTFVLGRPGDDIFTYSAGRRRESELNPGKDETSPSNANTCSLVFTWEKTRNKQNEMPTEMRNGRASVRHRVEGGVKKHQVRSGQVYYSAEV